MYAPSAWCLDKLRGVYATRPSTGPHKLRECLPLRILLENRLKLALSNQESIKIVKDKSSNIKIDGKKRSDHRFPLGFMDVVSIWKTGQHYRMLYDVKGRFQPHAIDEKEASFNLCKVTQKRVGKNKIPYIVTHDGRTIRFPHPDIKINDTVKINLSTHEVDSIIKIENGSSVFVTGGNNIGRVGVLQHIEHHPGSYEIAHIRDSRGESFATRLSNIFVMGAGKKTEISLPKQKGIRLSLIEERNTRKVHRAAADDEDDEDEEEEE
jgi:small subunit ribosomal protein S4e